jgi:exopolysaccharide biosynthesis protein
VEHTLPEWEKFEFIVGGAPLLIKNYQIVRDYDIERLTNDFVKQLHARSAIGLLEDGHWLLVVADQNLWNKDIGMTVPELARFMKTLGCKHAINLDGGISSGLYFNDRLINQPWFEREIGDAILVLP